MKSLKKIYSYLRRVAKKTLHAYLAYRNKFLMFGYHPGVKMQFISSSDQVFRELKIALLRSRAFPGDLNVFQYVEKETKYLGELTNPDKISIDIGANLGFYSALLAPLSSHVITCEANRELQPYLLFNLYRYDNVSLLPFAVSDGPGDVIFNIPRVINGDSIGVSGQGGIKNVFMQKSGLDSFPVSVQAIAIDALSLSNVGFMKIDVEGSELDVLQGATLTIDRCRPNIVIENEYRHNPECQRVFDFFSDRKYNGYFVNREMLELRSLDDFSLQKNQLSLMREDGSIHDVDNYVFNFIFVPHETDDLSRHLKPSIP